MRAETGLLNQQLWKTAQMNSKSRAAIIFKLINETILKVESVLSVSQEIMDISSVMSVGGSDCRKEPPRPKECRVLEDVLNLSRFELTKAANALGTRKSTIYLRFIPEDKHASPEDCCASSNDIITSAMNGVRSIRTETDSFMYLIEEILGHDEVEASIDGYSLGSNALKIFLDETPRILDDVMVRLHSIGRKIEKEMLS